MLKIKLITTGALSEAYWRDAAAEYIKRLGAAYSEVNFKEVKLPPSANDSQVAVALAEEGKRILAAIPPRAAVIAMCVEGKEMSSPELAKYLGDLPNRGVSEAVFVIGSAYGLAPEVKARADVRLSMSRLTFPHQLAKVMLLEAIYRATDIARGGKYHKE